MKRLPEGSKQSPKGELSWALVAGPPRPPLPLVPFPATVETRPSPAKSAKVLSRIRIRVSFRDVCMRCTAFLSGTGMERPIYQNNGILNTVNRTRGFTVGGRGRQVRDQTDRKSVV